MAGVKAAAGLRARAYRSSSIRRKIGGAGTTHARRGIAAQASSLTIVEGRNVMTSLNRGEERRQVMVRG